MIRLSQLTLRKDAKVNAGAPALLRRMKTVIQKSDTTQGVGFRIAELEPARARKLSAECSQKQRAVFFRGNLDRLLVLLLGHEYVRPGHVDLERRPTTNVLQLRHFQPSRYS
jgi:hypothetical protein